MNSFQVENVQVYPHDQLIQETQNLLLTSATSSIAICSVHHSIDPFLEHFSDLHEVFIVENDLKLPFKNLYKSKTLGNDRISLAAGALTQLEKEQAALIIDAGTCITYDYLDNESSYHGGAISPGLNMRFQALHTFTSKLPLVSATTNPSTVGNTTIKSIQSGVQNGIAMEIDAMIEYYLDKENRLKVFLTGGDSELLSIQLKNRFFADSNLTLRGIYNLYLTNKKI